MPNGMCTLGTRPAAGLRCASWSSKKMWGPKAWPGSRWSSPSPPAPSRRIANAASRPGWTTTYQAGPQPGSRGRTHGGSGTLDRRAASGREGGRWV